MGLSKAAAPSGTFGRKGLVPGIGLYTPGHVAPFYKSSTLGRLQDDFLSSQRGRSSIQTSSSRSSSSSSGHLLRPVIHFTEARTEAVRAGVVA